jgi:hypothetical protein
MPNCANYPNISKIYSSSMLICGMKYSHLRQVAAMQHFVAKAPQATDLSPLQAGTGAQ